MHTYDLYWLESGDKILKDDIRAIFGQKMSGKNVTTICYGKKKKEEEEDKKGNLHNVSRFAFKPP